MSQPDRIEEKLDRLLAVLDRFLPILNMMAPGSGASDLQRAGVARRFARASRAAARPTLRPPGLEERL